MIADTPPEVEQLLPREREIARLVFARQNATATQVQEGLSGRLKNASVRCALNRLVAKGILARRPDGRKYIYEPALTPERSARRAFRLFAEDHFGGSLVEAAEAMTGLFAADAGAAGQRRAA
ncbi:BlaI/MecI/CopY family transcriptional regulator [Sphingomonas sp. ASV193]|uniref:BlaI/MecI/CopY family transcriptional regulator n=1 Tax=Sphingomonas sp. ASV193 TaxID=3144405 RepID=UPI0032E91A05